MINYHSRDHTGKWRKYCKAVHAPARLSQVAKNESGEIIFMLAQSYMPAQDIHVLINPKNSQISPWYQLKSGEKLYTPEWVFEPDRLKQF